MQWNASDSLRRRALDGADINPVGDRSPLIVGLGGATRSQSTSERALRFALEGAHAAGARTMAFVSDALELPMFPADRPERTPEARRLVQAVQAADGLIIASPGYHGGVSREVTNTPDY